MIRYKLVTFAIVLSLSYITSRGQQSNNLPKANTPKYPMVGRRCPNFVLTDIEYFDRKQASLNDFKGKWLILDFWTKFCGSCIMGFSENDILQRQFKDKIQFLLVGMEGREADREREIRALYAKHRAAKGLDLPCAFDSVLFKRFDINGTPYMILIDDRGVVQAITAHIDSSGIADLLAGKHPELYKVFRKHQPDDRPAFNAQKPFLIAGNGNTDTNFLYRSVLSQWTSSMRSSTMEFGRESEETGRFQVLGFGLYDLYNFAYFGAYKWGPEDTSKYGKICQRPVLELENSSLFKTTSSPAKNLFCYSLIVPRDRAKAETMMGFMQSDLKNYFGYLASIEYRKCPYLRIISSPSSRQLLRSKGADRNIERLGLKTVRMINYSMEEFLSYCCNFGDQIYLNETGIDENIDITFDMGIGTLDDAKRLLQSNGLDLVPAEKPMKVLVIRESDLH